MVVELWVYTLIFIPLALMIGIAAATIGFTAWNIFVPLAFVGFGFPLWDALFVSITVDFVDAILLTFIYQRRGKVDFRAGIQWGVIAIAAGLIAAGFALTLLPANTGFLKGGVGYIVMIVGAGFFLRGWKALKKAKNSQKLIEMPELGMKERVKHEIPEQNTKPKTIFAPRTQISIMVVGVVISGALGGLLGMGSGLNFALLFLVILGYDTLRATGTACFVMALLMGAIGLVFVWFTDFFFLLPYLAIAVSFSTIGTLIGSYYALRLSEVKLNFMVGTVVIIAAVVATVQNFLL